MKMFVTSEVFDAAVCAEFNSNTINRCLVFVCIGAGQQPVKPDTLQTGPMHQKFNKPITILSIKNSDNFLQNAK